MKLLRAKVFHTPNNPFLDPNALWHHDDAGLLLDDGRIVALDAYNTLRVQHPNVPSQDLRHGFLLPGFVDCHVHFPQVGVIGAMGLTLLEWLEQRTLPLEAKMQDVNLARRTARDFVRLLLHNGTTSALVFATHFASATQVLFEEADAAGLRLTTGLVMSDRLLRPELHHTPERALQEARTLAQTWHGVRRSRYAVVPRFSLSCSEAMLEVCQELLRDNPTHWFTSHINENPQEIQTVRELFPWAQDYLATYERFGLVGPRSVFAHSVHPSPSELGRMARSGCSVAHCPSSNMFIGSGLMPFAKHQDAGVRLALGSDVGGGTGLSLFKEALAAYQMQMLQGTRLTPAQLLYLATLAGAQALGMDNEIGSFEVGKHADMLLVCPPQNSTLARTLEQCQTPTETLGALFTLAQEDCISQVWIAGEVVAQKNQSLN